MEITELKKYGYAKLIKKALSHEECDALIARANKEEWKDALVNDGGVQVRNEEYRNCKRVMLQDDVCLDMIMNKVNEHIPPLFGQEHWGTEVECEDFLPMPFVGLNPLLRFVKYTEGQYFKPHQDSEIEFPDGTCTILTLQMYLNDDFEGGETAFYDKMDGDVVYKYTPEKGDVLIFDGILWHEGCIITNSVKYSLRTEAIYDPRKQVVQIPQIPQLKKYGFAKLLPKILLDEDCDMMLVMAADGQEWSDVSVINKKGVRVIDPRIKNCKQIMFDDENAMLSTAIMDRIFGHIPVHFLPEHVAQNDNKNFKPMRFSKLNTLMRFFQYSSGGSFNKHRETGTEEDGKTVFTIQMYLNDDYEGGEVVFYDKEDGQSVFSHKPKKGDVLIFYNKIWCRENTVRKGMKFSCCTGLMCIE